MLPGAARLFTVLSAENGVHSRFYEASSLRAYSAPSLIVFTASICVEGTGSPNKPVIVTLSTLDSYVESLLLYCTVQLVYVSSTGSKLTPLPQSLTVPP